MRCRTAVATGHWGSGSFLPPTLLARSCSGVSAWGAVSPWDLEPYVRFRTQRRFCYAVFDYSVVRTRSLFYWSQFPYLFVFYCLCFCSLIYLITCPLGIKTKARRLVVPAIAAQSKNSSFPSSSKTATTPNTPKSHTHFFVCLLSFWHFSLFLTIFQKCRIQCTPQFEILKQRHVSNQGTLQEEVKKTPNPKICYIPFFSSLVVSRLSPQA